jgi:hypothetical protein
MTAEDDKQDQLTDRDSKWKRMAWTIYRTDDPSKSKTVVERFDNHIIMTLPFAEASQEKAEEVRQRVLRNETSPIEYFMYKRLLDPKSLAESMGMAVWRVKRHFKPDVFRKLDENTLQKYAKLFRVNVDDLLHFREDS